MLLAWPLRSAEKVDNVKPMLGMKKGHEGIKDATKGRSGAVWEEVRKAKAFLLAGL